MAERAVPEVMGERHGFGARSSSSASARAAVRAICATSSVWVRRAEMVALVAHEHLRLVLEAAERGAVHDPVAVALERAAQRIVGSACGARGCARMARKRRERPAGAALEAEAAV